MTDCRICHEAVEDDGYGEPVHAYSGLYWHGSKDGSKGHVATV